MMKPRARHILYIRSRNATIKDSKEEQKSVKPQYVDLQARELKSKKISNDQELIQSDPISCPQNKYSYIHISMISFGL